MILVRVMLLRLLSVRRRSVSRDLCCCVIWGCFRVVSRYGIGGRDWLWIWTWCRNVKGCFVRDVLSAIVRVIVRTWVLVSHWSVDTGSAVDVYGDAITVYAVSEYVSD